MPTGPKGEKRPADAIARAVKVMRIATGEEPEDYGGAPAKNEAAADLGKKRAEVVSPDRRETTATTATKAKRAKHVAGER